MFGKEQTACRRGWGGKLAVPPQGWTEAIQEGEVLRSPPFALELWGAWQVFNVTSKPLYSACAHPP